MSFRNFPAGTQALAAEAANVPGFTNNVSEFDVRLFPTDALAGCEIDADGAVETYTSLGNQGDQARWDNNNGPFLKSNYQFRLDTISGSINQPGSEATDTWLPASAGVQNWGVLEAGLGTQSFSGTLRIRLASSPFTEYASATLTLTAESTN